MSIAIQVHRLTAGRGTIQETKHRKSAEAASFLHPVQIAPGMPLAFIGASSGNTQSIQGMPGWVGSPFINTPLQTCPKFHCAVFTAQIIRGGGPRVFAFIMRLLVCARVGATSQQDIRRVAAAAGVVIIYARRVFTAGEKLSRAYPGMPHMQTHRSGRAHGALMQAIGHIYTSAGAT